MTDPEQQAPASADREDRPRTFHHLFLPVWDRLAHKVATSGAGAPRTFAQHRERVLRLANSLHSSLGLQRDGRFAVLALNSPEYLELYHAAYLGGGVINPLNIRLSADELTFILNDSETEVAFVDSRFATRIDGLRGRVPTLRSVILIGSDDKLDPVRIDGRYESLVAAGATSVPEETSESDAVCLLYTGGTTGLPKGAVHTQRSHIATALIGQEFFQFEQGDVFLAATPLFHGASFGAFLVAPAMGCAVSVVPAFQPQAFQIAVKASGATHSVLVPTMIRMLIDSPDFDANSFNRLKMLMYGGSAMPPALLERVQDLLPDIELVQGYGMTEGVPITRLDSLSHRQGGARLASAGQAIPGVTVSVQGDDGQILPSGSTGELCMRSDLYMVGYWNRPKETEAAFRDGWYRSGDIGYMDDEGFVFLVDRATDMIVSGGENVYTSEVEAAIATHPGVEDVAVIGIPNANWGEAVHAVVVQRDGHTLTETSVLAHARLRIANYKVPRSVDIRTDSLPLSGAGKTLKRSLRDPFWAQQDRHVN